jgi:8-oxo-dGTP diphosphatase
MSRKYTYEHPRAALTVDCVVFGLDEAGLQVLLIQRQGEPYAGRWALPGGFVNVDEELDTAARRELAEETGLQIRFLEQLYTFGGVQRDPRERVVTVAYFALVRLADQRLQAASDARDARWFTVSRLPRLAFDHAHIVRVAHERLRGKVGYQPIGFELLPVRFTLRHLQQLDETILGRPLDKRNFRKKLLSMELRVALDEWEADVAHRAARLYQFDKRKYQALCERGFHFEI